ncbi:hypothetical protein ACYPKM_04000 [Pseudomonas aeruginosa]
MAGELHKQLVQLGVKWMKKNGFGVVASELTCFGSREQPDVIGFRSESSAIIEAKASRADFLADKKKPERYIPGKGLGIYRFYLCPEGLIKPDELPTGWGLLYQVKNKVVDVIRPPGNMWPNIDLHEQARAQADSWAPFQHQPDREAERRALYSIARRKLSPS